jgi:acyl-coenzyme A thioesterase 13
VTFFDAQDRVVAYGSHTKHMGNNIPQHRFSEDGEQELEMEAKAKL